MSRFCLTMVMLLACLTGLATAQAQTDVADGKGATISVTQLPEFRVPVGQVYYERYCLFCHGVYGQGDGMNAFSLPQRPANLLQKTKTQKPDAGKWQDVILAGGAEHGLSAAMPAYGLTLTPPEIKKIISYLLTLPGRLSEQPSAEDSNDEL